MNKDGRGKDSYARRGRRCPDDRRRWIINSFPVPIIAIRPIHTAVVIITASVLLVTAVVLFVIFAVGRHHVYNADHGD
jgi:hypothetical protein